MSLSLSPLWTYPVDHSVDYSRYGMTRHDIWNYLMSNLHNIESYNGLRYLNSHTDTLLPSQEPRLNMTVVQIVAVGEKTSTITTNSGWSHQLCWLLGPWPTWPPKTHIRCASRTALWLCRAAGALSAVTGCQALTWGQPNHPAVTGWWTLAILKTCAADASRVSACVQKRKDQPARAK